MRTSQAALSRPGAEKGAANREIWESVTTKRAVHVEVVRPKAAKSSLGGEGARHHSQGALKSG